MTWAKMRQMAFVLLAAALLAMSLLFAACGSSATNAGNSNIQQTTTASSTGTAGSTDQQVQNAVQSIDGAQNDVNNADATATTENGSNPQP